MASASVYERSGSLKKGRRLGDGTCIGQGRLSKLPGCPFFAFEFKLNPVPF